MTTETAFNVREYYLRLTDSEKDPFSAWSMLRRHLLQDAQLTRGARLATDNLFSLNLSLSRRIFVEKMFAAEIFPDRNPPEIVSAKTELETHEDLRKDTSSKEPRISGEIVYMKDLKFFMLDSFSVEHGSFFVMTKTTPQKVVELLLERNFIPVDSSFNAIPTNPIEAEKP